MEIPKNYIYFSYDADGMGRKVGQATLANDIDGLRHISSLIDAGHELVKRWVRERNGIWINGGGDEGNAAVRRDYLEDLENLRKDYKFLVDATISIGVGRTPSEAGRSLLIAKLLGKDRIVVFSRNTEKEIKRIKKRAKKGIFRSMEEYKLSGAYLNKQEPFGKPDPISVDCEYCRQAEGTDPDHCPLCHDVKQESDCPLCGYDNPAATTHMDMPELAEQDCAFCQEMDQKGKDDCPFCQSGETQTVPPLVSPDSNNAQAHPGSEAEKANYESMGMHPPEIGKPSAEDHAPVGQNAPMDTVPQGDSSDGNQRLDDQRDVQPDGEPLIDEEDNHSKDALMAIAGQIETDGTPTQSEMDSIDDTQVPVGHETEGNISRPPSYAQDTPSDMGLEGTNQPTNDEGDEPDFADLLEEGLNAHADSIQRERTIQIVSQALNEFKAAKGALEQSRAQMPQLYQASLSMLKAMIQMSQLLGLGQNLGQSGQPPQELGQVQGELMPPPQQSPTQGSDWHEPFPTHPDHGGEPKPGHSPSKDGGAGGESGEGKTIGQPIGKLSAKHTTEHVARTPMPVGAINQQGQQKVMDNEGNVRFIDRKQGMVQGPSGVPVKPPKRGESVTKN